MGTFVVSMKVKRNANGDGMFFSGTPVAVNAAGTFRVNRFVTPGAAPVVTLSTGVVDSPLNAGQINGVVAQPVSFVSVLATGAVADGTTDDFTAIAAAISQAALETHKTVFFPAGTYAYNGNITASGVTLAGIGPTSILLAQNPSQRGIFLVGSSAGLKSVLLQNSATAFAAGVASVDYAGVVCGGSDFLVHNVYVDAVAGPGIDFLQSAGPGVILQNTLSGCKANVIPLRRMAHDILVKLNFVVKGTGAVGVIAATADAAVCEDIEMSYNWIKDNSGTGASIVVLGAHRANVHNNLCQSNSAHAGIVIAQDGATGPHANLSCSVEYNTIENCGRSSNNTAALMAYNTSVTSVATMIRRNRIINSNNEPGIRAFGLHSATTLDNNQISVGTGVAYVDAATAGIATNLFAGGNAGYPFTVPGNTESVHGDSIPPLSELLDSRNATWTVNANGTALRNGVATISNAIDLLLYHNRRVYQNTVNGWWVWDDNITSGNQWVATTDPRVLQVNPPTFPTLSRHPADFLQAGNPAIATYWVDDNRWGAGAISEGFGSPTTQPADGFPRRIVATYWEAYNSFNQSYVRIQNISTLYNVIFLFHCQFNANGSPNFPWLSPSEVRAVDVQTCRNRGQKVILTIGGAGNGFQFDTRTESNNFLAGIQTIISNLGGVDGLDFNNYEQIPPNQATINEIIFISQQLKSIYGSQFAISTPPEPTNNTQYMELARQMDAAGVLTFVSPQFYDRTDVKQTNVIFNFMTSWISAVAQASQCVIGLGSGNYNTGAATTLAEADREVSRVLSAHPTIRGVFSWNANFDAQQGFSFANTFHNKFSAADAASGGGFSAGAFTQTVERALTAGPEGQVAFKTEWTWPTSVNGVLVDGNPSFNEVKGFPSLIYGARPGYRASGAYPANEKAVRLPDGVTVTSPPANAPNFVSTNWVAAGGTVATTAPSGATNSNLPRQLLISAGALIATGRMSSSASGKAHIAIDVWLQAPANPTQTAGFANSPITHEIMVPLRNFGNYGAHGNRSSTQRHSHDVVIEGVTYHVYHWDISGNGALRYNFGSINGNYTDEETGTGRTGWKFIVFQHDGTAHPLLADGSFRINLGAMVNHIRTRTDSRGIAWCQGTEHAVSVEIGVEPVVGEGEMILWDYRVV